MAKTLVYIDEPAPSERHREAAPVGAVYAQARIPAVEADASKVIIGTPADEMGRDGPVPQAHRDWQEVRDTYEAEKTYRESEVDPSLTVEVAPEMDPEVTAYEPALADIVGTSAAETLADEGFGTLAAAKALGDDVTEFGGIGPAKKQALQDA